MARPNVTVRIVDESLSPPFGEVLGPAVGALVSRNGLLLKMGVTTERQQGYLFTSDINDWFTRLRTYTYNTNAASPVSMTGATLTASIGPSAAAFISATNATAGSWQQEWWAVHNFLQYGASCYVGGTGSSANTANVYTSLQPNEIDFDVMFHGGTTDAHITDLGTVIDAKTSTDFAAIGVLCGTGDAVPSAIGGANANYKTDKYVHTWGHKLHFDTAGNLIRTNVSADVAGCIARTDRDFYPWFSPAGRIRGRILNVVRIEQNLTDAQQDTAFDAGINPVVTFPGEGTILFGDKTGASDTSTLSRINVSRLFIFLRKLLSPVARAILFEQNDEDTRARFRLAADSALNQIRGQRGVSDYKIICDSSNNTPDLIQQRIFVADILVKPVTAINYVRLTFTNKNLSSPL
jgi:hypothetical protein